MLWSMYLCITLCGLLSPCFIVASFSLANFLILFHDVDFYYSVGSSVASVATLDFSVVLYPTLLMTYYLPTSLCIEL